MRFWPPYLGAGIRVDEVDEKLTRIQVSMKLTGRNTNVVGTHFGGSLYSMCDPWFMFMLMRGLGDQFIVWDQAAEIDFIKPGKGTVRAVFELDLAEFDRVRELAQDGSRQNPIYEAFALVFLLGLSYGLTG